MNLIFMVIGGVLFLRMSMGDDVDSLAFDISGKCTYRLIERPFGYRADCSKRNLTKVPSSLPTNITYLDLRYNKLETLPAKAFSYLSSLKTVALGHNNISRLDPIAFIGMDNLTEVLINDNKLPLTREWCATNPFSSVTNLRHLDIQRNANNDEKSYLDYCLSSLTSLERLTIDGINDVSFGSGFQNLTALSNLNMGKSPSLTSLGPDVFLNLQNLSIKFLSLSRCNLQSIDRDTFRNLPELTSLDLSHNINLHIKSLDGWLHGLKKPTQLRKLKIHHISDPRGDDICVYKTYLRKLYYTAIEELNMNFNMIYYIDTGDGSFLPPKLKIWKLVGNKLTGLDYMKHLNQLPYFERLDARNQYSSTFAEEMTSITTCNQTTNKNIDWAHAVSRKNPDIKLPPRLLYLRLTRSNDIGKKTRTLKELRFKSNVVKYLHLCCNNFGIQMITVTGLDHVECLDLSMNHLQVKPGFFKGFSGLVNLNLSVNYIGKAMSTDSGGLLFNPLVNLEKLNLSGNYISRLFPVAFASMHKLKTLILSDNKLEGLGARIGHMRQLKLLDLRNNNIQYFSDDTITDLQELSEHTNLTIILGNNSLVCNCDSLHFLEWAISYPELVQMSSNLTCKRNKTSAPVPLGNLDETLRELKSRCASYADLITGLAMAVLGSVLVVVGGLTYRYRWKLRYLYYIAVMQWKGQKKGYTSLDGTNEGEFEFDVFVSYADEDRFFVVNKMRQVLERDNHFRLCIHHRDFIVGDEIAANITRAIHGSRKTLILLSPNFLKSYWCMYEFQMARMEAIYTGRDVLLIVMYDSVSASDMPYEVLNVIQYQSYLERPRGTIGNFCINGETIPMNESVNSTNTSDMQVFWNNLVSSIKSGC